MITFIYGEPCCATVTDMWDETELRSMAREGYVVLSFDNEGTPQPRGRAWRKAGYGAIGVLSSEQQAEAMREFARTHAYVDTSRMAIWGWSGGGTNTLNMMFRYPGLYGTGVAVAPVPDQTRYDSIYQERYMGLPAENAKGYHDGSAINFAEGLSGNLLLIHGSGDDNVHFQGSELLVNRLIALGKPFTFMDYPNRSHGIYEGPRDEQACVHADHAVYRGACAGGGALGRGEEGFGRSLPPNLRTPRSLGTPASLRRNTPTLRFAQDGAPAWRHYGTFVPVIRLRWR